MRVATWVAVAVVVAACGQTAQLGGTATRDAAGGETSGGGRDGTTGGGNVTPNKCAGSGAGRVSTGTTRPEPASCTLAATKIVDTPDASPDAVAASQSTACAGPAVCIVLPGRQTGHCGPVCQSDCDCPVGLTCQSGLCAVITECPVGQMVVSAGSGGEPYTRCAPCTGNCPACTSNTQCGAGQVCRHESCGDCASDSECGPGAHCVATHTTFQCTCSVGADCLSGESCSSGVCTAKPIAGCRTGGPISPNSPASPCKDGQLCIDNVCGPCTSSEDCTEEDNDTGLVVQSGLACISGTCEACTANSQCGGGQACVDGTCGTCVTHGQCGGAGQCSDGFCVCTIDSQCATGQRCGAGVCVEM